MALSFFPLFPVQLSDGNGNPLSFGKLTAYYAGTTNKAPIYNNNNVLNSNPITLDVDGFCQLKGISTYSYDIVVQSADGFFTKTFPSVLIDNTGGGGGGGVDSVNGQTGDVTLDASDVGAVSLTGDSMTGGLDITGYSNVSNDPLGARVQEIDSRVGSTYADHNVKASYGRVSALTDDSKAEHRTQNTANNVYAQTKVDSTGVKTGVYDATHSAVLTTTDLQFDGVSLVSEVAGKLDSVVAGTNITVDNTDPQNPIISSTGGGAITSVNGQTGVVVLDATDVGALPAGGTAVDSDKLDGHDSTYFATATALDAKAPSTSSSTGLLTWTGTKFAIVDATHVRIGAGTGQIVDTAGVITSVTWAENTNLLDAFVGSTTNTYYLVDSAGSFVQQSTYPTPTQQRANIYLGFTAHAPVGTLLAITAEPTFAINEMSQVRDIFDGAFRHINDSVTFSANGANLQLNRSAGYIYGLGLGVNTSLTDPSRIAISSGAGVTFQYRTQTGVATGNLTSVDTANYDVGGTVTSIPSSNKWTNQRIYVSPSGVSRLQLGQNYYNSQAEALASVQTETFVTYPPFKENFVLVGVLCVKQNATVLNSTASAIFVPVSKFGEVLGGSAGTSTTTLQQAYENGTEPEIITTATRGALSVRRGSSADTDNVIEVQNGAGSTTASINGNGVVTTTKVLLTLPANASTELTNAVDGVMAIRTVGIQNGLELACNGEPDATVQSYNRTAGQYKQLNLLGQPVRMSYGGNAKLETTNTGVDVTGTLNATTGLQVNGSNVIDQSATSQVKVGGSIGVTRTTGTTVGLSSGITGEAIQRIYLRANGNLDWSDGTTIDNTLSRVSSTEMSFDKGLRVVGVLNSVVQKGAPLRVNASTTLSGSVGNVTFYGSTAGRVIDIPLATGSGLQFTVRNIATVPVTLNFVGSTLYGDSTFILYPYESITLFDDASTTWIS